MCVIMYKPVGKVLNNDMIKACFATNRDGAGYMYAKDGSVIIKKGFMHVNDMIKSLNETLKELGGTSKRVPMVLHFRIGTQGGIRPEMTHPYPVCRDYNKMKKLNMTCEIGMAHNGILRFFSDPLCTDHNDSMEYVHDCAADIINGDVNFPDKKNKMRVLERMSRGSRIIFLDKNGRVTRLGGWEEFEGYYFSHYMSFMTKVYQPKPIIKPDPIKVVATQIPKVDPDFDRFLDNIPDDLGDDL